MPDIRKVSASFVRPSNTTAYAAGDLVADNTTAGSVTPITLAIADQPNYLRQITLRKTQATITNANFRVWFLSALPTVTNGDNGAFAGSFLTTVICEPILVDVTALLTGGGAIGTSFFDHGLIRLPATAYALIEAMAAYTPASGETFTLDVYGQVTP